MQLPGQRVLGRGQIFHSRSRIEALSALLARMEGLGYSL